MPEHATESASPQSLKSMDDIVALCRRRGFIFQSSEIYGGINGFWDYGPLGARLKKNLKDAWWHDIIECPPDGPDGKPLSMEPVDATIIMNPKVWEASGHVAGFNDPMVDCRDCKGRFRADHVWVLLFGNPQEWKAYESQSGYGAEAKRAFSEIMFRNDLSAEERREREEIIRNANLDRQQEPPTFPKSVLASSRDEAIEATELSNQQRKDFAKRGFELLVVYQLNDPIWDDGRTPCPQCGAISTLTEPRQFNLMFETYVGALRDEDAKAYLRPETAQGIFTNFRNVVDTSRVKVPFGIAQIGKAFRNEVTPRNFTFRSREFEQMEIEFFIPHPDHLQDGDLSPSEWYAYWRDLRYQWWQAVGLAGANLQLREHDKDELAHYAKEGAGTSDVEYRFPFTSPGFGELEGVAHRTDFDLRQHAEHSGLKDKLAYFDQERGNKRYFPHVIEPSAGADRGTLALICEAYTKDESRPSKEYMAFTPRMAPIKAGVFPLVNKDGMPEIAEKLYKQLRTRHSVQFDVKQSIGKRYARMDEAGTPYCFTIDGQTLEDNTVTVRDRDTQSQDRINIDQVPAFLDEKIGGPH